jgi:K(+)-stimulated pyrophosphate-energized sodium pump
MIEIAQHVRDGAMAYLSRQYKVVGIVFVVLVLLLTLLAYMGVQNPFVPVAFLTGGFFSGLCGFLGMKTATFASARTAHGASQSLNKGLQIAFRSGAVMGLVVVGFALLDVAGWFLFLDKVIFTPENMEGGLHLLGLTFVHEGTTETHKYIEITATMLTFGMGASTQALFARVGGGIYTKAADVGADLVGKVEAGIPEDDPRNPATIADNVGDNVGDVAGMGADLYESYAGSILATAALGAALVGSEVISQIQAVTAPNVGCCDWYHSFHCGNFYGTYKRIGHTENTSSCTLYRHFWQLHFSSWRRGDSCRHGLDYLGCIWLCGSGSVSRSNYRARYRILYIR